VPVVLTAFVFAGNVFLCSCGPVKTTEPEVIENEPVTEEVTETVSEPEEVVSEVKEVEEVEEVVEEPEEVYVPTAQELSPYKEIKLDGVKEHHFVSDDYCYIESEKYVLFLDKDVDLPGDFVTNMDAIVDEIERQLQVSCMPEDYEYCGVTDNTSYYGMNPWEDWDIRPKMSIFIMTDEDAKGYISNASADDLVIADYALYSEDVWNSNPEFYASEYRVRFDYVDYYAIAHELTHTVTLRQSHMTDIMTEGIADYMSREVVNALAPAYPSIGENKAEAEKYLYDAMIPEKVNADNAERIFISDYQDIDHADRGAEYVTGRYLCQFLDETYGDDFYLKYKEQIDKDGIDFGYDECTEEVRINYANALKEVFGDDVFTKFGDWCVENHALQELGGVWSY
jgi:hypothetical protein